MEESARPAGVDDEPRARRAARGHRRVPSSTDARALVGEAIERRLVEIDRRLRPRPRGRARGRSPAGTNACRRSRRAGWPRPAADARGRSSSAKRSPGRWKKKREAALQAARRHPAARAARFPISRTRGGAADRSGRPALRAAGWPAAWTTRRSRIADGGRVRSARRAGRVGAARARSATPANPEPTTATSTSIVRRGHVMPRSRRRTCRTRKAACRAARGSSSCSALAPGIEAVRDSAQKRCKIPEVHEDPASWPVARERESSAALDVSSDGARNAPSRRQRLHRAVTRPRRDQRDHRGAGGERDVDRTKQPRVLLVRAGRTAARSAETRAARHRCAAARQPRSRKSSTVIRLFKRSSARGARSRDPSRPRVRGGAVPIRGGESASRNRSTRGRPGPDAIRRPRGPARRAPRRSAIVAVGNGARIEEAAGVVELDLR